MRIYKAAIIGLGQIGLMYDFDPKRMVPASHVLAYHLNQDIELIAGMDLRVEQEHYFKQLVPEAIFYSDLPKMLEQCSFDIISICTQPESHLNIIKTVLGINQPKIIFCEKPVVSNVRDAIQLRKLLQMNQCLLLPNLSRRWSSGIVHIYQLINQGMYGKLQKIHFRYTRGIYNTGSHMIDMIRLFAGDIDHVQAVNQVPTSSDLENDPSYSFHFWCNQVSGYVEAFDDRDYYIFEMDLYLERGKIEVRNSGDLVKYYNVGEHHLFSGFKNLCLDFVEKDMLDESNLKNAVEHIVKILERKESPVCNVEDGIYPLLVAEALIKSYKTGSFVKVDVKYD